MEEKRTTTVYAKLESDRPVVQFAQGQTRAFSYALINSTLKRGKWLLLFSVAAFTLIGLMLGELNVPLYRAQTSIEILSSTYLNQRAGFTDAGGLAETDSYLQTQIRIIQSRSLLERTLAKFTEAERARLLETPHFWWTHTSYDQKLESIRMHISTKPSDQAGIVDISFLSPDPVAGAHFLNSLTQELADYNVERTWRTAQHNREWNDRQLGDLRRRWEDSEQVVAEYARKSGIDAVSRGFNQAQPIQTVQSPMSKPAVASSIQAGNDPKLRELTAKLAGLHKQITQWESVYGVGAPSALKFRAEATATETAIRRRRSSLAQSNIKAPAEAEHVQTSIAHSNPSATNRAETLAHLDVLRQEADSNRRIYETTDAQLREAGAVSASHIGDINVVDPAIPNTKAVTPGTFLNGVIGGVTGVFVGIAFVALRDRFSHTFQDPALLNQVLELPVLGAIPEERLLPAKALYLTTDEPTLHLAFDTDIDTAEAYRSIRSSILLTANQRSGPRRLVFTSAGLSEGKTAVVGNLGAALACAQRRVLLVDGDLRNPSLHRIFGADNDHGLADLLSRQITSSPIASRDVIRQTQIPDLYLLTAGQAGAKAPEILSSAQLPQLIREFAKGFDIVLVDSPPVLPYSDARSLARAADGVVLIVRASATARRDAVLARDIISQDGAPVIGAILTDWDRTQSASA